jgi:hypothetical protein
MRHVVLGLLLALTISVGIIDATAETGPVPESQVTLGPGYEPSGLRLAMGPHYEPGGLRLAMGPSFEPSGLRAA